MGEPVKQVRQRALQSIGELQETVYKSQSDTYAVLTFSGTQERPRLVEVFLDAFG